jgi:hypothetical protein
MSHQWGYTLGVPWDRHAMIGANNGELIYWAADVGAPPQWEVYDSRTEPMTAAWIKREVEPSPGVWIGVGSFSFGRFTTYGLTSHTK